MYKDYNLITNVPFEKLTGSLLFNLTNDYMFKAILQECTEARVGLISALLGKDPSTIETEVTNPIELGKSIASKDFYLDVKVIINKLAIMNLEMQVEKLSYWDTRSLSYCCRSYDQLYKGGNYKDILPFHQIGFTCFDVFKEDNKFYDTFHIASKNSSKIYTDTFLLSVVNLKRINEATETDKRNKLDKWCRFITASTWEELKELAKEDSNMQAAAEKLYLFSSDFEIREEAIRRRDYYNHVHSLEAKIAEQDNALVEKNNALIEKDSALAEKDSALAEKDNALAEKDSALAEKDNALIEKDSALAEKDNALAEKDNEIAELKRKLASMS